MFFNRDRSYTAGGGARTEFSSKTTKDYRTGYSGGCTRMPPRRPLATLCPLFVWPAVVADGRLVDRAFQLSHLLHDLISRPNPFEVMIVLHINSSTRKNSCRSSPAPRCRCQERSRFLLAGAPKKGRGSIVQRRTEGRDYQQNTGTARQRTQTAEQTRAASAVLRRWTSSRKLHWPNQIQLCPGPHRLTSEHRLPSLSGSLEAKYPIQ